MTDAAYRELEDANLRILKAMIRTVWIPGEEYEDLLQECRIALWRAAERYDPTRGALASFAWREAVQRIGHLRASARTPTHQMLLSAGSLDDPRTTLIPAREDPGFGRVVLRAYLRSLMETLNDRERRVVEHLAQGHSWEAAAAALGASVKAAKMLWFSARRKMAAVVQGERPAGKPVRKKAISHHRRVPRPVRSRLTGVIYPSAAAAARAFGLAQATIGHAIRDQHQAAGAYWEYVEEAPGEEAP